MKVGQWAMEAMVCALYGREKVEIVQGLRKLELVPFSGRPKRTAPLKIKTFYCCCF